LPFYYYDYYRASLEKKLIFVEDSELETYPKGMGYVDWVALTVVTAEIMIPPCRTDSTGGYPDRALGAFTAALDRAIQCHIGLVW
jgi:hypothetical protein